VDVARLVSDGRKKREVHQIDDRAALDHPVEVRDHGLFDALLLDDLDVALLERHEELIHGHLFRVVFGRILLDVAFEGEDRLNLAGSNRSDAVDRGQILRLGHRDKDLPPHFEQWKNLQPFCFFPLDQTSDRRINQTVAQVGAGNAHFRGQRLDERVLRKHPKTDEGLAQFFAGLLLLAQRAVKI
jgi:hypothetical protein